jgi:hypothetical protein
MREERVTSQSERAAEFCSLSAALTTAVALFALRRRSAAIEDKTTMKRKALLLAVFVTAGATLASPVRAQDERTACAGRSTKMQLLCSGDGCMRFEVARICEALRREPMAKLKRIRSAAPLARPEQELEQLIASLD